MTERMCIMVWTFSLSLVQITKVFGSGPKYIREHMVSHLYKYAFICSIVLCVCIVLYFNCVHVK